MQVYDKFTKIKTLIFDVDGVFTDNGLIVTENGSFLRTMSARDGFGVKYASDSGYRLAIITGGDSMGVKDRLDKLGIKDVFLGIHDKKSTFLQFIEENNLDPESILYMGDDVLDLSVLKNVFLPVCPSDAVQEVKEVCEYISPIKGGKGCVRDVIEKVLRSQGKWLF